MSDNSLSVEINGETYDAAPGEMLIQVADRAGIQIPRFCYHSKLSVAANCRMCLVEVEKAPKPLPACATPVMDGMKVKTRSPLAIKAQKSVMEFLLINHPLDCPICDQGGECELQDVAMGFGGDVSRYNERKRVVKDKNLGPLIATDMTRCIHCTRCVRFGEEIGGMPELGATGRGENLQIGTFIERAVDSEMSGNVIDLCPVGALTSKPFRFRARAWEIRSHDSVAAHDGVGSNVHLHVAQNRVMRVVPRENESLNEVWISDRDRFSYEGLYSDDRLLDPMVKVDGEWRNVDWEDALGAAADALRGCVEESGPQMLGVLTSPGATTEEQYLAHKLARGLGTNNIDHRLRLVDSSDQNDAGPFPWLGTSLEALEQANAVLLLGSEPRKEQPIVNHRLRKASLNGARIMSVNVKAQPFNYAVVGHSTVGPAHLEATLEAMLSAFTGGGDESDRSTADYLKSAERAVVLIGPALNDHPRSARLRALARQIADAAGASLGELASGANAAGAALAGALPHRTPGGGSPAGESGLAARAMLAQPRQAYLLMGIEPELDCADGAAALAAMHSAQRVVVLSAFATDAMREYADVLLPVGAFAETSGTFVNMQGGWQSFEGAAPAPGQARPAWKVLRVLGNVLDLDGFEHTSSADILAELQALCANVQAGEGRWSGGAGASAPETDGTDANGSVYRIGDVPMYACDAVVRRAASLQRTAQARFDGVALPASVAEKAGLGDGAQARIRCNGASIVTTVNIDPTVPDGCVSLPSGLAETAALGPAYAPVAIEPA